MGIETPIALLPDGRVELCCPDDPPTSFATIDPDAPRGGPIASRFNIKLCLACPPLQDVVVQPRCGAADPGNFIFFCLIGTAPELNGRRARGRIELLAMGTHWDRNPSGRVDTWFEHTTNQQRFQQQTVTTRPVPDDDTCEVDRDFPPIIWDFVFPVFPAGTSWRFFLSARAGSSRTAATEMHIRVTESSIDP